MRRLPVFILLDTSGSMKGEPIESVKSGLEAMLSTLRADPTALESAYLCLITFDREAKVLVPLSPLDEFMLPELMPPDSGPTHTGAALRLLCEEVDRNVRKTTPSQKGDWKPLLFLMTDGKPSDLQLYRQMAEEVKKRGFAAIVPCAAGMKASTEPLKLLSEQAYALQTMDEADFRQFFKWVSASIMQGNQSMGAIGDMELPPPPEEIAVIC